MGEARRKLDADAAGIPRPRDRRCPSCGSHDVVFIPRGKFPPTLAHGTQCVALVTAVAFTGQAEAAAEGLVSIPPPTPEDAERWARHIMGGGMRSDDG